jgi:hypothetical protein
VREQRVLELHGLLAKVGLEKQRAAARRNRITPMSPNDVRDGVRDRNMGESVCLASAEMGRSAIVTSAVPRAADCVSGAGRDAGGESGIEPERPCPRRASAARPVKATTSAR